jgi:hypothetical protein
MRKKKGPLHKIKIKIKIKTPREQRVKLAQRMRITLNHCRIFPTTTL